MISTILGNISLVLSAYAMKQIEKDKEENVDFSDEKIDNLLGEFNKMMDDYEEKEGEKPKTYEELRDAAIDKVWKDTKEVFADENNIIFRASYSKEYNMKDVVFFVDKTREKVPNPVRVQEIANEFYESVLGFGLDGAHIAPVFKDDLYEDEKGIYQIFPKSTVPFLIIADATIDDGAIAVRICDVFGNNK